MKISVLIEQTNWGLVLTPTIWVFKTNVELLYKSKFTIAFYFLNLHSRINFYYEKRV